MKNINIFRNSRTFLNRTFAVMLIVASGAFYSCNSDDIKDGAYYTFVGETVSSYCQNNPELSVFYQLINDCGASSLLSVYGHFTCFAPTNGAFETYFREHNLSLETMPAEDKLKLVYDHVIRGEASEFMSKDFQEGALSIPNMSDRYLVISFQLNDKGQRETLVNKNCKITGLDNEVHNGVVHVVDRVIIPSEQTLLTVIKEHGDFSIWAEALQATGLDKKMEGIYDPNYKNPYNSEYVDVTGYKMRVNELCKLGFTIFCEPDDVLRQAGITDLNSLATFASSYYGSQDMNDYTSENNPVNKFIAYHLLNRQMSTNSFVYSGPSTAASYQNKRYEYYETMLKYRLMEIKAGNKINTQQSGECVEVVESKSNIDAINGFIHTLNKILVYDETVMTSDVLHKRIRFDFMAVPPQLTNNNIRWQLTNCNGYSGYTITPDFCGEYFTYNDVGNVKLWASNGWSNYQADELVVKGWYDFRLRMLPVPPGNYEIRFGYNVVSWRGVSQLFIDDQIAGIPVDLRINGTDPRIGYIRDADTKDDGIENDKVMRNRGYMKGPKSVLVGETVLRDGSNALRAIVGQYHFDEYGPHYFRAKNVESENLEFMLDYVEYIPVDLIETEDRD